MLSAAVCISLSSCEPLCLQLRLRSRKITQRNTLHILQSYWFITQRHADPTPQPMNGKINIWKYCHFLSVSHSLRRLYSSFFSFICLYKFWDSDFNSFHSRPVLLSALSVLGSFYILFSFVDLLFTVNCMLSYFNRTYQGIILNSYILFFKFQITSFLAEISVGSI